MITQFKIFENNEKIPEIGDYICVFVDYDNINTDVKNFYDFINNKIGIVYYNDVFNTNNYVVEIIYSDIPENLKYFFTKKSKIFINEIIYEYSTTVDIKYVVTFGTKEEVKLKLKIKKYNL
ncbi:hypothetical protein M0Q97_05670 [Candidatus Dojkabacteria bacterium]|jgi:uncharacterized protein (DUF2164 family)|nr:hypothetical protein [Candidatus Dojkabacteria bacterium]